MKVIQAKDDIKKKRCSFCGYKFKKKDKRKNLGEGILLCEKCVMGVKK